MKYIRIVIVQLLLLCLSIILSVFFIACWPDMLVVEKQLVNMKCINNDMIKKEKLYDLFYSHIYLPEFIGIIRKNFYVDNLIFNRYENYYEKNNESIIYRIKNKEILIISENKIVEQLDCKKLNQSILILLNNKVITVLNFKIPTTTQTEVFYD